MRERQLIDIKKCKTDAENEYSKEFAKYKKQLEDDKKERIEHMRKLQKDVIKAQFEVALICHE